MPPKGFLAIAGLLSMVFNIATADANATCLLVTKLQIDKVELLSLHQLKLHLILNKKTFASLKLHPILNDKLDQIGLERSKR